MSAQTIRGTISPCACTVEKLGDTVAIIFSC
jgi:hypothetical protein